MRTSGFHSCSVLVLTVNVAHPRGEHTGVCLGTQRLARCQHILQDRWLVPHPNKEKASLLQRNCNLIKMTCLQKDGIYS